MKSQQNKMDIKQVYSLDFLIYQKIVEPGDLFYPKIDFGNSTIAGVWNFSIIKTTKETKGLKKELGQRWNLAAHRFYANDIIILVDAAELKSISSKTNEIKSIFPWKDHYILDRFSELFCLYPTRKPIQLDTNNV
jgi:hypothetical protein